jgi:hypothetical protein
VTVSQLLLDVAITVSTNGVTSDPMQLAVLKPSRLMPISTKDAADSTYGYTSTVHYRILDRLGTTLPHFIGFNEQFTSAPITDFAGTNWRPGPVGGNTQDPLDAKDVIEGEALVQTPTPKPPRTVLSSAKVTHRPGQWYVGSNTVGSGVKGQTNIWQKYLDHARHTQIVSSAQ